MPDQLPRGLVLANMWLDQIRETTSAEPDTETVQRIRNDCYRNRPCRDCGTLIGQPHEHGCDVERCMWTGEQWIACGGTSDWRFCDCEDGNGYDPDGYTIHTCGQQRHDCGSQVWDGTWHGYDVAISLGLYGRFDNGWWDCGPEHPDATPDLSCWRQLANWDRDKGTWTLDPKHAAYLRAQRVVGGRL